MTSETEYEKGSTFASLPRTTRGLPLVISGNPDGKKLLYCNGNSVYIRDVENIAECDVYTEHAVPTTVAKFAPSGFYIASGDQAGKIRIWDTTQTTHILKAEYPVLSGPIRDISWSEDSKRIAVVGEGRDRFGHVFLYDTGTSNGNLSGQSRPMSSIDFRPTRPYRLVSSSEDNTVAIFEGPPFKFKTLFHEHTRFAHCVRYNKDGLLFASGGADGKVDIFEDEKDVQEQSRLLVILFDGEAGGKVGELVDESAGKGAAHSGGVFALSWSPDGKRLATASGDKTVKLWAVADRQLVGMVSFGTALEDQQLAVLWLPSAIVSVSLAGFLSYIDPETQAVSRIVKGHNRPITALALSADCKFAFTADFEGHITRWTVATGESERLTPALHKSQVGSLAVTDDGTLVTTGWDDAIAFTPYVTSCTDDLKPAVQKLTSQPRGVAARPDLSRVAVACHKSVLVYTGQKSTATLNIPYEGTCVDVHPIESVIAVGGQHGKVHVYEVSAGGDLLIEKKVLAHAGAITSLKFSPNGKVLVATDGARKVVPYEVAQDYKVCSAKDWSFHTARVNCCAWSADSRYIATGGIDTNIIVWDLHNSGEHPLIIKGAHPTSPINSIAWLAEKRIITAGQDSNLKQWTLKI